MKLSYEEIIVLRTILNLSGETEPGEDGKEVRSLRKLNGKESSQRRSFTKNTKSVVDSFNDKAKEKNDQLEVIKKIKESEYNKENDLIDKKEHKRLMNIYVNSDEEVLELFKKLQDELSILSKEESEIEVTQETLNVIKKYVLEWQEKVGLAPAEDEIIYNLTLKLE